MGYTIYPDTKMEGGTIVSQTPPTHNKLSLSECERLCNSLEECVAFEYNPIKGCHVKHTLRETEISPNTNLYVKGERSNFWWLWIMLIILGVLVFVLMCSRSN